MLGMAVGTLITICTNVELIDGKKITSGDIGIILQCFGNSVIDSNFDYLVLINNIELYVFEDEIKVYT